MDVALYESILRMKEDSDWLVSLATYGSVLQQTWWQGNDIDPMCRAPWIATALRASR